MRGKTARMIFLGACIAIAALLLTKTISPTMGGLSFAGALVLLGVSSRGFSK